MIKDRPTNEPVTDIMKRLRNPLEAPKETDLLQAFNFIPRPKSFRADTDFYSFLFEMYGGHIYEYPTKEYIENLGTDIAGRIKQLGGSKNKPVQILEVAAGFGRLTHLLTQKINQIEGMEGTFTTVATDNFTWNNRRIFDRLNLGIHVEDMDYETALENYRPDIVIGSWLPSKRNKNETNYDLTKDFRHTPSVRAYYLIGIPSRHATNEALGLTYDHDRNIVPLPPGTIPEYELDGFEKKELDLGKQFCNESTQDAMHLSKTFVFTRK